MSDNYNPKPHLTSLPIKNKEGKVVGEKPYLGAHDAILWFLTEHPAPEGRLLTFVDMATKLVRAEVYIGEALVATGHSFGDGSKSLEKLETNAIRRALANAGYGTVAALAEEDSDARVALAAHEIPTEETRARLGSGNQRRLDTSCEENKFSRMRRQGKEGE